MRRHRTASLCQGKSSGHIVSPSSVIVIGTDRAHLDSDADDVVALSEVAEAVDRPWTNVAMDSPSESENGFHTVGGCGEAQAAWRAALRLNPDYSFENRRGLRLLRWIPTRTGLSAAWSRRDPREAGKAYPRERLILCKSRVAWWPRASTRAVFPTLGSAPRWKRPPSCALHCCDAA